MTYVDVLCLMRLIPTTNTGIEYTTKGTADAQDEQIVNKPQLEPVFMDLGTGRRPEPPVASKCRLSLPCHDGAFVAHVATDDSCGITQVGRIEWQPLSAILTAYWALQQVPQ